MFCSWIKILSKNVTYGMFRGVVSTVRNNNHLLAGDRLHIICVLSNINITPDRCISNEPFSYRLKLSDRVIGFWLFLYAI